MTTIYSGLPGNVTTPLVRGVNGATNVGGGIKISTSSAHLFSTADIVTCADVGGVPNANGTFAITVVDSTHFTLNFSTFAGAYTSGGTATDYSLTPAATLPSDGEQVTASSILDSVQLLLDRTQYLATLLRRTTTLLTVPANPFNLSYAANWIVGDNGVGSASGQYLTHASPPSSDQVIVELTPFLVGQSGRTLAQCNPVFAVGQSHASVPANLPSITLYTTQSLATLGVAPVGFTSMRSGGASVYNQSGSPPASGAAYYASGHLQSWTVLADQNNVIDVSRRYFAIITDEYSTNSHGLNTYLGFQLVIA
jgi:hypothetical protein